MSDQSGLKQQPISDFIVSRKDGYIMVSIEMLLNAGAFKRFRKRLSRDAGGRERMQDSGRLTAQLLDPFTKLPVGRPVDVFALRGIRGVPSRVGAQFFSSPHWLLHQLGPRRENVVRGRPVIPFK
jgi:hypothetical protein